VQFIQAYSQERGISLQNGEGEIVNENGDVIGRHDGVHNFTIGQRKGLGSPPASPFTFSSIDRRRTASSSAKTISCERQCAKSKASTGFPAKRRRPLRAFAKIRHKHEPAPATIEPLGPPPSRA